MNEKLAALKAHGCLTGDCPHDSQTVCDASLAAALREWEKEAGPNEEFICLACEAERATVKQAVPACCATCGKEVHKVVFCSQGCAYTAGYYLIGEKTEAHPADPVRCYHCEGTGIDQHDNDPMGRSMNQPCTPCKGTGQEPAKKQAEGACAGKDKK